jgi:hypothetical protein
MGRGRGRGGGGCCESSPLRLAWMVKHAVHTYLSNLVLQGSNRLVLPCDLSLDFLQLQFYLSALLTRTAAHGYTAAQPHNCQPSA